MILFFFIGNLNLETDGTSHLILFSVKDPKQESTEILTSFSLCWFPNVMLNIVSGYQFKLGAPWHIFQIQRIVNKSPHVTTIEFPLTTINNS